MDICEKYKIKITDIEKALDKQFAKKVNVVDSCPLCPVCGQDGLLDVNYNG